MIAPSVRHVYNYAFFLPTENEQDFETVTTNKNLTDGATIVTTKVLYCVYSSVLNRGQVLEL